MGQALTILNRLYESKRSSILLATISPYEAYNEKTLKPHLDWARKYLKSYHAVNWYTRVIKRAVLLTSELRNPRHIKKREHFIQGYDENRVYDDFFIVTGKTGEFKKSIERLTETANTTSSKSFVLQYNDMLNNPATWVNESGKDKPASEIYDLAHSILELAADYEKLPQGDTIIEFSDKSKWVILSVGGCKEEANLMRHCGNMSNANNPDQKVISYRVIHPTLGYYQPKLTFILHTNGGLGEMKGYANSKPKPEYHDKILSLLKDKRIKFLFGEGYREEVNFNLEDLSDAHLKELAASRPDIILNDKQKKFKYTAEQWKARLNKVVPELFKSTSTSAKPTVGRKPRKSKAKEALESLTA